MELERSNFRWSVLLICVVLSALFLLNLPVTFINRIQEHWYLGIPYERIKQGMFWVDREDPFPENGPHLMYLYAKLVHATGSLLPLRLAQWLWTLLAASLTWLLLGRLTGLFRSEKIEVAGTALIFLFFWASLPLGLVYPIQMNGAMAGFASLVGGLLLLGSRPAVAMLLFGFAYANKAQFIMYFPCVIAYRLFLDFSGTRWARHLGLVARDSALLFVPAAALLPLALAACGFFRSFNDFFLYSIEGPTLLGEQVLAALRGLAGIHQPGANPQAAQFRHEIITSELASYSKLVYMHIFFWASMSVGALVWTLPSRLPAWWGKRSAAGPGPEVALLSVMGCAAFVIHFKLNNYPYAYNMLFFVPFNAFLVPYAFWIARNRFRGKGSAGVSKKMWRGAYAFALACVLLFCFRYTRNFLTLPAGDALTPYYWMGSKAWDPRSVVED